MGIPINATVEDSLNNKRRSHSVQIHNRVETEIEKFKENLIHEKDVSLWKNEKGVLKDKYNVNWESLIRLTTGSSGWSKIQIFIMRYMLQSTVHTVWREQTRKRSGESAVPAMLLIKRLDKNMRNQFTVIQRRGDKEYGDGMAIWFDIR
ncbi:hypothetical protein N665_0244s0027 [Sinapis alba]|nr:hypothetical protein N665_0244s0027 [Sinapis alba]